jgi:hypothetical protein
MRLEEEEAEASKQSTHREKAGISLGPSSSFLPQQWRRIFKENAKEKSEAMGSSR